ncbi:uncharacterized protein EAF01_007805 [Botrytis porri]|uniref:Tyrosine specific protein phosphatases domain-containing protein n=1 Tax=Botrytis porri TaxID=87229 RepID=A0A4Z1L622_9HELO|nr:uncharacterized protein EAF01_007805 [Botrytis porri]KAF7900503.1 hypothetical protein EAF01_007805 [Botrytis porri]TGO92158.1 hypothetical protein BPOR_0009g00370 [Botrytis porri]
MTPPMLNGMDFTDSATSPAERNTTPTTLYSWRPPSPPHIHVPPLSGSDTSITLSKYRGLDDEQETREILSVITQGQNVAVEKPDWKYELRRHIQAILSFLYLGPSSGAREIETLRREGITMLLVIRDTKTAQARILSGAKVASQLGIEAGAIDVSGNMELIAAFPKAIQTINDHLIRVFRHRNPQGVNSQHLAATPKVLLFCESGNERSAAVAVAYIMATYELGLIEAIQYVQNQRFCIAFDDEMKHTLLNFHQLLEARRSVTQTRQAEATVSCKSKRRLELDDDDGDVDMDCQQDDRDRFSGRTKFAPFM